MSKETHPKAPADAEKPENGITSDNPHGFCYKPHPCWICPEQCDRYMSLRAAALAPVLGQSSEAHPDAELIRLCEERIASLAAFNADPDELDSDDSPHWAAYQRMCAAMEGVAPRTLAGAIAKARVTLVEEIDEFRDAQPRTPEFIVYHALRGVVLMAGGAA